MAWIKMRSELQSHPKIVRILSATTSDKFRVVGGLHAVWSVFDQHSTDGTLFGYTPETMDHVIGWTGFSQALLSVGWLSFDGVETLTLPEFDEHNSKGAKRRAEDQKRKRNDRNDPQNVPQESGQIADKKRTREEKRREDSKQAIFDAKAHLSNLGIEEQISQDWLQLRKTKKAAVTETAIKGIQREADQAGLSLRAALMTCCERGWTGFKAEWVRTEGQKQNTQQHSAPLPINQRPFV